MLFSKGVTYQIILVFQLGSAHPFPGSLHSLSDPEAEAQQSWPLEFSWLVALLLAGPDASAILPPSADSTPGRCPEPLGGEAEVWGQQCMYVWGRGEYGEWVGGPLWFPAEMVEEGVHFQSLTAACRETGS